jgi:hypothetical protein
MPARSVGFGGWRPVRDSNPCYQRESMVAGAFWREPPIPRCPDLSREILDFAAISGLRSAHRHRRGNCGI